MPAPSPASPSPENTPDTGLQTLLAASLDAAFFARTDGTILAANAAAARMFGYSLEEFRQLGTGTVFPAANLRLSAALAACERDGLFQGEITLARRNGEEFPAVVSFAQVRPCGGPECLHLVIRDNSDRATWERILKTSAIRYTAITATTTDGCWEVDGHGRIMEANDRCSAMYGYSREELLRMSIGDFEANRNLAETAAHIREIKQFGYARFDTRHRCKDARILDIEVSTSYQPDSGRFVAFLRDITARKHAEVALRETEERYRGLVESAFNGSVVHQHGVILTANAAYARTFGYSVGEMVGRPVLDLIAPEARADVATRIEQGSEECYTTIGLCRDGSRIPIEVAGKRCSIDGRVARVAAVRDLTERHRAEREREKLQAQLFHAQKMESVGRLAGGVAHDFNNMLTAIQCNVSLAREELPAHSAIREYLDEIQSCTRRSAELTRQLLAFARKQTIAPQVVDLNVIVAGTLKMLQRIIGEDIELLWRPGLNLWPAKIDPSQVDQLLANLCVNARDAISGVGSVTLKSQNTVITAEDLASSPDAVAGEYVMLAVEDTGCGMNSEVMSHLFEPFFTTKKLGQRTGLGLATVYGIVKQNGGFIQVQSAPGQGTIFKLLLPRNTEAAPLAAAEEATLPLRRGHETILLVEDEYSILRVEALFLERLGYRVLAAGKPGDALRLAEEYQGELHLLITDVVMPEMNGLELSQRLLTRRPGLRVVLVSGYTASVIHPNGVIPAGGHFLQKPFSPQELAEKVRAALE